LTILTAKSLLIKISKILKYRPGIYKQFLFSSTNSIYVLFTAQFRTARIFHQYKFLCTVPRDLLLVFYFPSTTVLCRITDFKTQACNVTLNPALVLYLGKLPVDAAIHALIFRQVNR